MQALPRRAGAHTPTTAAAAAAAALHRSVVRQKTQSASSSFVCSSCRISNRIFFSSSPSRRNHRAPPPPPPPGAPPSSGYAALPSRRVISLAGPDAARFLQGMITSNMNDLTMTTTCKPNLPGFYTGFLQATGRVLYDVFIYPDTLGLSGADGGGAPDSQLPDPRLSFLIECDGARVDALMRHIKKYKLRSKFQFRVLAPEECMVWQAWNDGIFTNQGVSSSSISEEVEEKKIADLLPDQQGNIVLRDPRSPSMGLRVVSTGAAAPHVQAEKSDADAYRVRRYLDGVAEGATEIQPDVALPLEANMDWMGGVDFRKGCYLGQELTIRTKHRGVVRKRILPVVMYGENEAPPDALEYRPSISRRVLGKEEGGQGGLLSTEEVLSAADIPHHLSIGRTGGKKGRSAGSFLDGVGNLGLGLCRLQIMTDVQLPGEAAEAAPFDPSKEFLMQWGGGGGEEGKEGEGSSTEAVRNTVKVKAFVPEWLRSKLDEGNGGGGASLS